MLKYLVAPMCLLLAFSAAAFANGHSWVVQTVATGINGANNHVQFVFTPDDVPVIGYMGDTYNSTLRNLYLSAEETSGVWTQHASDKAYSAYGAGGMTIDAAGNIYTSYVGDTRKIKRVIFDKNWNKSILSTYNTSSGSGSGVAIDNLGQPAFAYSTFSGGTETLYLGVKSGSAYTYGTVAQYGGAGFDFTSPTFDSKGNVMFSLVQFNTGAEYGTAYYYKRTVGKTTFIKQAFAEHAIAADGLFIGENKGYMALIERLSSTSNRILTYQFDSALGGWYSTQITSPLDYTPVALDIALDRTGALGLAFADKSGKIYYMHYNADLAAWSSASLVYTPLSAPANPKLLNLVLNYDSENEAAVAFYDPSSQSVMYALDPPFVPEIVRPVPEPTVIVMMGTGLAAIAGIARKMRK